MNPEPRQVIVTKIAGRKVYRQLVEFNGQIGVKTAYDFLSWDILSVDSRILSNIETAQLYIKGQLDHLLIQNNW